MSEEEEQQLEQEQVEEEQQQEEEEQQQEEEQQEQEEQIEEEQQEQEQVEPEKQAEELSQEHVIQENQQEQRQEKDEKLEQENQQDQQEEEQQQQQQEQQQQEQQQQEQQQQEQQQQDDQINEQKEENEAQEIQQEDDQEQLDQNLEQIEQTININIDNKQQEENINNDVINENQTKEEVNDQNLEIQDQNDLQNTQNEENINIEINLNQEDKVPILINQSDQQQDQLIEEQLQENDEQYQQILEQESVQSDNQNGQNFVQQILDNVLDRSQKSNTSFSSKSSSQDSKKSKKHKKKKKKKTKDKKESKLQKEQSQIQEQPVEESLVQKNVSESRVYQQFNRQQIQKQQQIYEIREAILSEEEIVDKQDSEESLDESNIQINQPKNNLIQQDQQEILQKYDQNIFNKDIEELQSFVSQQIQMANSKTFKELFFQFGQFIQIQLKQENLCYDKILSLLSLFLGFSNNDVKSKQLQLGEKNKGIKSKMKIDSSFQKIQLNKNFSFTIRFNINVENFQQKFNLLNYQDNQMDSYEIYCDNDVMFFCFDQQNKKVKKEVFQNISKIFQKNKLNKFQIINEVQESNQTHIIKFELNDQLQELQFDIKPKNDTEFAIINIFKGTKCNVHSFYFCEGSSNQFEEFYENLLNLLVSQSYKQKQSLLNQEIKSNQKNLISFVSKFGNFEESENKLSFFDVIRNETFEIDIQKTANNVKSTYNFNILLIKYGLCELLLYLFSQCKQKNDLEILITTLGQLLQKNELIECIYQYKKTFIDNLLFSLIFQNKENLDMDILKSLLDLLDQVDENESSLLLNGLLLNMQFIKNFLQNEMDVNQYFDILIDKINYIENLRYSLQFENVMQLFIFFLNQQDTNSLLISFKFLEIIKESIQADPKQDLNIEPLINIGFLNTLNENQINLIINCYDLLNKFYLVSKKLLNVMQFCYLNLLQKTNNFVQLILITKQLIQYQTPQNQIHTQWRKKLLEFECTKLEEIYIQEILSQKINLNNIQAYEFIIFIIFGAEYEEVCRKKIPFKEKYSYAEIALEFAFSLDEDQFVKFLQTLKIQIQFDDKNFFKRIDYEIFMVWCFALWFKGSQNNSIKDMSLTLQKQTMASYLTNKKSYEIILLFIDSCINFQKTTDQLEDVLIYMTQIFQFVNGKNYIQNDHKNFDLVVMSLFKQYFCYLQEPQNDTYSNLSIEVVTFLQRNIDHQYLKNLKLSKKDKEPRSSIEEINQVQQFKDKSIINSVVSILNEIMSKLQISNITKDYQEFMNLYSKIAEKIYFYLSTEKNIEHKKYQCYREMFFCMFLGCYNKKFNIDYANEFTQMMVNFKSIKQKNTNEKNFLKLLFQIAKIDISLDQSIDYKNIFETMNKLINDDSLDSLIEFDKNYKSDNQQFILETIGSINDHLQKIQNVQSTSEIKKTEKKLLSNFKNEMEQRVYKFNQQVDQFLILQAIEFYDNKYQIRKIIQNLFQKNQLFFEESCQKYFQRDDYDEGYKHKFCPYNIIHRNLYTKEYQRPFLKIQIKSYWNSDLLNKEFCCEYKVENYLDKEEAQCFDAFHVKQLNMRKLSIFYQKQNKELHLVYDNINENHLFKDIQLNKKQEHNNSKIYKLINLKDIQDYIKVKFMQHYQAVNIWTKNNSQYLLYLPEEEQYNKFISCLNSLNNQNLKIQTKKQSQFQKQNFQEKWLAGKMSNFQYLMLVNMYGSRNYLDFSQYPVFPLLVKRLSHSFKPRDLSKPVGMIGNKNLKQQYKNKLEESKVIDKRPSYNYGSHYSTPQIVFHFLIRLHPYSDGSKSIHNNKFDIADRIFFSLRSMFKNIRHEMSDVRELIPEFYYLPMMFLNQNQFNFGTNQKQELIDHVKIPQKINLDAYSLVYKFRSYLESFEVSERLGDWLDLIFGIYQKGDMALQKDNLFYYLTYEEAVKDKEMFQSMEEVAQMTQIYHFGQIPTQIFKQKHPNAQYKGMSDNISNQASDVRIFQEKRGKLDSDRFIIYTQKLSEEKIFVLREKTYVIYKVIKKQKGNVKLEKVLRKKHDFFKKDEKKENFIVKSKKCFYLSDQKYLVLTGLANGFMKVYQIAKQKYYLEYQLHQKAITNIIVNKDNIMVSCDKFGIVKISQFQENYKGIDVLHNICSYYEETIQQLEFQFFDSRFFLLQTNDQIDIRSLKNPTETLITINANKNDQEQYLQGCLSFGYVSCVVILSQVGGTYYLKAYAMDGQLLVRLKLSNLINKIKICKNFFKKDILVCFDSEGDIKLYDLPFLQNARQISNNNKKNILHDYFELLHGNSVVIQGDQRGQLDIVSIYK